MAAAAGAGLTRPHAAAPLAAAAQAATTSHGVGLREAMEVGRRLMAGRMPAEAFLVGVEGRGFDAVGTP